MIYVFSDGALSANGVVNNTVDGRGKLDWASDNQSTAASIVLVHRPAGRVAFRDPTAHADRLDERAAARWSRRRARPPTR